MTRPFRFSCGTLVIAGTLVLTLSACSKNEPAPVPSAPPVAPAVTAPSPAASQSAPTPAPVPAQVSQDEADPQQKLNLYIECYNQASSSFRRSLDRYASWVTDMNVGPTGTERIVYGLYPVDGAQDCKKAVAAADALPPKMAALEQAADAYAASLEPLESTINTAFTYYDRANYKDDGLAKGKALHHDLAAQAKVFSAANRQFSEALDEANDQVQRAQLQRLEKEHGRDLRYYHLATMIQAKALIRILMQKDVDVQKAGPKVDAFEQTADAMAKATGDKPMMWDSYASDVEDFRKAAKELYRRQRDKTPYNPGERQLLGTSGGWMVDGSPDKLINKYNAMVDASNQLN